MFFCFMFCHSVCDFLNNYVERLRFQPNPKSIFNTTVYRSLHKDHLLEIPPQPLLL